MTATVYTQDEVDKLIAPIIKRLEALEQRGNMPAPDPDPAIAPDVKVGDRVKLVSFLDKEVVLLGRVPKGAVIRFANTRSVNVVASKISDVGAVITVDVVPGAGVSPGSLVEVVSLPGQVQQPVPTPDPVPDTDELGEFCANLGQAGGGDSILPGKAGTNYFWASEAQIARWAKRGLKKARIGIAWERLQPVILGPLRNEYLAELLDNMELFGKYGVRVLVDVHNYGGHSVTGNEKDRIKIGTKQVPYGALADLWSKLTVAINNRPSARAAYYGADLMNEPVGMPEGVAGWAREAQLCIDAIRRTDMKCAIAVEAYDWGTTARFKKVGNEILFKLVDPANLTEIHTHIYMDVEGGGKYLNDNIGVNDGIQAAQEAVALCKKAGFKHCFGEVGAPGDRKNALAALAAFLPWARDQGSDCYAWWATETATDNIMSLEAPRNAPVVALLQKTFQ